MKTTTFNIYKDSIGILRLEPFEKTMPNEDWEQYLRETDQSDRADRLLAMSSRKRSPKVWKIRKSKPFAEWQQGKTVTITSHLYGMASADYDGRIPEWRIKAAIIEAVKYGESEARYYPASNAKKPAHEHIVYVFGFNFKKVEG